MISAPLHTLTSSKTTFNWNEQAELAFTTLKRLTFIVDVKASSTVLVLGAVLSECSRKGKINPCDFFLGVSPVESNYDVGERELLVVKLALEEWRHWLEGSKKPFQVWTDHKNLEYLKTDKRLNPRQVRWALFLLFQLYFVLQIQHQHQTRRSVL